MKKSLAGFLSIVALSCVSAPLFAATYSCQLTKVTVPNPYLPEKIVFSSDQRFQRIKVTDVQIKNVSTQVSLGQVENRSQGRVRFAISSAGYVLQGLRPRQPGSYRRLDPSDYNYSVSLRLSDNFATVRIEDRLYLRGRGSVEGPCQVSK